MSFRITWLKPGVNGNTSSLRLNKYRLFRSLVLFLDLYRRETSRLKLLIKRRDVL